MEQKFFPSVSATGVAHTPWDDELTCYQHLKMRKNAPREGPIIVGEKKIKIAESQAIAMNRFRFANQFFFV